MIIHLHYFSREIKFSDKDKDKCRKIFEIKPRGSSPRYGSLVIRVKGREGGENKYEENRARY